MPNEVITNLIATTPGGLGTVIFLGGPALGAVIWGFWKSVWAAAGGAAVYVIAVLLIAAGGFYLALLLIFIAAGGAAVGLLLQRRGQ